MHQQTPQRCCATLQELGRTLGSDSSSYLPFTWSSFAQQSSAGFVRQQHPRDWQRRAGLPRAAPGLWSHQVPFLQSPGAGELLAPARDETTATSVALSLLQHRGCGGAEAAAKAALYRALPTTRSRKKSTKTRLRSSPRTKLLQPSLIASQRKKKSRKNTFFDVPFSHHKASHTSVAVRRAQKAPEPTSIPALPSSWT